MVRKSVAFGRSIALLVVLMVTALSAYAQTTYFSRSPGGNWNSAATWSTVTYDNPTNTGTFPIAGDIVFIGGTGSIVTITASAACATLDIDNSSTLNVGQAFAVSGTTTVGSGSSGVLAITSVAGAKVFGGLVFIDNGALWNEAVNEAITFQGGITNNGTFTAGTGVHTFNANSQVLNGTFSIPNVTVTGGAVTLTNTNTLTVNNALSGSGRITQGSNAVLNIGGTSGITNMTASASGNTVNYTGAGQTVKNVNYVNLGLSGSGVKTLLVGTTSISGNFSFSGTVSTTGVIGLTIGGNIDIGSGTTFTSGAFTHNVAGDWTNNGTFNGTGGSINLNGTAQNISGGTTTFNDLLLSGSGTKTFSVNTTISNELSIASGAIANLSNTNTYTSNTLILAGALQGSGTWGSTSSSPPAANQNNTFFSGNGLITVANGGFTYYSIASADWSAPTTWSTTGFGGPAASSAPGAGDYVIIGDGQTVTISGTEECEDLLFDAGTAITNTLSINTGSLTVAGVITIPQTVTAGSNILNVGAGTLTAGDINFTATPTGAGHQLIISTGTATVSGNVTGIGASSTIQFTGAGLLQVGGAIFTSANGTLTSVAGSTVEYNGAVQTVQALGYSNLTLSGSGTKTLAATATVGGNLTVGDGTTFTVGAFTFNVNGTTIIGGGTSGTLSFTSTTGIKTFTGLVTVNTGAVWSNTANEGITFQGGITNNGTFTAGNGAHTFNTNSQALTGTFTIPSVSVTGAAVVLTNNNSLTVNTSLNGSGRITQGTGATLNIGGPSTITNMTATATGNTVNYTGAAQTVKNVNYENVGLSGSGIKTLQAGTTAITGDLTLSGSVSVTGVIGLAIGGDVNIGIGTTFTSGAFTYNIGGDFVNNGTFTGAGSTIIFNGAAQNISGGSTTFDNVTFAGSGTKTFGLSPTTTISGSFIIDTGVVASLSNSNTYTANSLILGGAIQQSGTWGSSSSAATNQNNTFFSGNGLVTIATGANNFYSIASTAWNVNTTWSNTGFGGAAAAGTPGPGDFVFIGGGFTVTVASSETCSALSFDAGTSVTNTLTINAGNSLTVTGAVTIPQTVTSGANVLDVDAGMLIAGSVEFTSTPGGAGHRMTIGTGVATILDNITGIGASSTIQFTGAGLLQVGGSLFSPANGTLTSFAGSTVDYTGYMGTPQTVQAFGYNNLSLNGSSTKTLAANTTVGGNLLIDNGANFVIGAFTFAVTGTTSVNNGGTLSFTSTTGTKAFTGLVTVNSGGLWNETVNESITFAGGITNNGTFTAGTGIHTFFNTSQALIGNFSIPNITVTGPSVVLTNTNILTVNNALNGTGQLTQGTGATLNIGGTSGITTLIATASGNTVNYTGAAQSVKNVNYENLGLSGSGIKTLQVGTTSITGDLILSGTVSLTGVIGLTIGGDVNIGIGTTFTSGAFNHNVAGDWINNGLFIGTVNGSVNLNGAGPQNISGVSTTFYALTLSGSGNKAFGVATTMADALSINLGAIADLGVITSHAANRLILNGALQSTTGTWGSSGSAAITQNDTYFLSTSSGEIAIALGGNNYYSIASTAWNVNTTWSNTGFGGVASAGTPGPGDFVFIGGGFTVTVASAETCNSLSFDAGTSVTNTLTINAGSSLTVTGTVTIPQTVTSGSNILDVGAGTLTVDNLDFTATPGGAGHQLTISTGIATVNGNLTADIGSGSEIEFTGTGLLQLGGSFYSSTNGTLTMVPGSSVEYNGTASQTVESHVYQNLVLSGNNTKSLLANATVSGNLTIGDGTTFNIGPVVFVVSGATTVGGGNSGTLLITSTTGTKTFTGLVTINTGALWNETVNETIVFQGGITNNGTFTTGTAAHTFNTNSQVLTGTFSIPNVTVTSPAVLTNTNSLTVNTALSGSGQLTQGTGAILNIGGSSTITNMNATASGNTVNYTGAAQTVKNVNYENLGLSGSGVKTLQLGTTTITGDLILSGTVSATGAIGLSIGGNLNIGAGTTFSSGAFNPHNVGGDFVNNGTFNNDLGTIIFNGNSLQSISGSTVTDFNNISVINNSGSPAVQVESNQNLGGILTLAAGSQFDADGSSNTSVFTLLSTADSPTIDASIAALPTGASVIGNVTVQRYMAIEGANSGRIYRYISSPVQAAPVSQIQSEIPVTGSFTGTSTCTGCGSSQSMFLYNESVITDTNGSGGNNADDGYEDFPNANNSETLTTGRGYAIFVRANVDPVASNGSARWDVRAPINSGTINFNSFTTFTSSGTLLNDGWNLVGNPYPSTINWDAAGWTKTGINNAIYLRDNSQVSQVYATYIAGVGLNGGSEFIATGQAFFVKSDGGSIDFQATENVKVAGTQTTFFREGAINDMVRVALKKGNITDETVIRFDPAASENFDPALDAHKLKNAVFNLSTVSEEIQYAINALPILECSSTVSLDVSNVELGIYNLQFSEFESFDENIEIQLMDKYLEQSVNIRNQTDYQFEVTSDENSQGERFTLVFSLPYVDISILPEGPAAFCGSESYSITLPTSESGVMYYASLNGTTISDNVVGTGSTLAIGIDETKLALGENSILVYAKRSTCDAVPMMESLAVTKDNLYQVQSTAGGTACQEGSVTLTASGAPVNGSYHWYESLTASEPISGVSGNTYTTPVLDKTKTYYVTAVNALGCEGERAEIKAEVVKYEEILITETAYGVLSSNYPTGNSWYLNDVAIPGATGQSVTVAESGVYRVEVTIGECKTADSYEFVVTGLETRNSGITIYPNPVVDEINIQGLVNVKAITLISNTGQQLKTQEIVKSSVTMDMKNYPAGLYLVKLIGANNAVSTFKVIKK